MEIPYFSEAEYLALKALAAAQKAAKKLLGSGQPTHVPVRPLTVEQQLQAANAKLREQERKAKAKSRRGGGGSGSGGTVSDGGSVHGQFSRGY
jgi:hypothetical protein